MTAATPVSLAATRLLLNALRPDQTPTTWESDRLRLNAGWDDLAVRAIVLGLAPQLHRRLAEWGVTPPPRAAAKLAVTREATARRNAGIFDQLGEALTAFAERNMRPIALKGVHLAALVYPDPALRPMNDIDLLFAPEELPAAESILESLGYGGKHKSSDLGAGVAKHTSTFRRDSASGSTPNPFLSPDSDRTIEPHTSLEESWFGLRVDITPGVRERAVEAELAGQRCRVLAREDLLLHLCVHFCFHLIMGAPSMVQLADLLAVTRKAVYGRSIERPYYPITVDWAVFVNRAVDHRAASYALAALTLAHNLLGAPIPTETLDALSRATPPALRNRIASLGLANVLRRTQQKPLTSISQRIMRGFADRAETARWAPDWRGRWQVWRTALNVSATDTGRLLIGRPTKDERPTTQQPNRPTTK
ncbi:MAG: nucleotidyltransferase family protein [Chloroflexota bacterium]